MFPVIAVVGWHNSGKTTIVERLVVALKARGLVVATIKHAHMAPSLDQPGTDTHRYAVAGSDLVGLVSHDLTTFAYATDTGNDLADVLARVPDDTDIVIVEGYKSSTLPKIEVCEQGRGRPIARGADLVMLIERQKQERENVDDILAELERRGFIARPPAV